MMLLSLQMYAGTVNMDVQTDDVIDVELNKGKSDNTLYNTNGIGMVCYYYVVLHVN